VRALKKTPLVPIAMLQAHATLKNMLTFHRDNRAAVTVLTAVMDDPYGYGRVVRDTSGRVTRIVEQKDADTAEQEIREINSGIYCMDSDFLFGNIRGIGNDNAQGEYYLTDLLAIAVRRGALLTQPIRGRRNHGDKRPRSACRSRTHSAPPHQSRAYADRQR
jgi:bifunctional N-acetylglucosamine-1-phosphate-uridyltransferase/glucosamine-1-phosphate-acetyltransferase GlmU-like protein